MDFSMFENMNVCNNCRSFSENSMKNSMESVSTDYGCDIDRFPEHTPLAMAYVPVQQWGSVYDEEESLSTGTIFPELNMPLEQEGGCYGQQR